MSVNPRKFKRNKRKLREIQERLDMETSYAYLESLKLDMKLAKRLQNRIYKKQNWKDYTV